MRRSKGEGDKISASRRSLFGLKGYRLVRTGCPQVLILLCARIEGFIEFGMDFLLFAQEFLSARQDTLIGPWRGRPTRPFIQPSQLRRKALAS